MVAKRFRKAGYHVFIVGRDADRIAKATKSILMTAGGNVNAVAVGTAASMSDVDQAARVASVIEQSFERLDVVVNCIGTSDRGRVEDLTSDRLHELLDQNVIAMLLASQATLPLLSKSRGSIVNIGSLAGKVGARYLGGYNAAKHALTGLTQQMRLEWRERGIHVALVSPGPIRRDDAGTRYAAQVDENLPGNASKPGGGAKVKGLDPERIADAVLRCAQKKATDMVLPRHVRLLLAIGSVFPRLGDWLLLRFTS